MKENVNEIFTGERFVPGVEDDEITIEHYQRYESIVEIVRDKVVVDAACGEGYGTSILGKTAKSVVGIDISEEAVERAKREYETDNVKYQVGDISKLDLEDSSIDVFVSFETIEHVNKELQKKFVSEVSRVLKDDGVFVISSPNKAIYSDFFGYNNEFHVCEMYKDEFVELLQAQFQYVKIYNQYLEVASIVDNNDIHKDGAKFKKNRDTYTSDGKYFIAIASKKAIGDICIQSVYLKHDVTYRKNIQRIFELQKEVDDRNEHLTKLDKEIKDKDQRIIELQEEHEKGMVQLRGFLDEIEDHVRQKEELLKLNEELREKIELNEYHLNKANKAIHDKDVHIGNLENIIRDKDNHINNLENTLRRIKKFVPAPLRKLAKFIVRGFRKIKRTLKGNKKMKKLRKLKVSSSQNPIVSIIIPVYNQFDYTYQCIKSIIEYTADVEYEIIIGDDVSSDETVNINKYIKGINVIRNSENLKFLLNCNNAAKSAIGKYILFLNNDTKVTEGWLSSLVKLIEADESIGMVGSKLVYPDGRLQEAGGIVWKDASAWNYGHGQDPEAPEYNYVREVDYISGASIMIKKALWEELGGFDEEFAPAYYEDTDLAFQVRKAGYKVMYQPQSVVVHFEGVSNGTDVSTGLKQYQVVNEKKFRDKWAEELSNHYENGEKVIRAKDRCFEGKKNILFIDHYVPHYDKDAGSRCVYYYLNLFLKKGYNVKFIGDNFYKHEPYTTHLNQMGIEVLHGNWYAQNIFTWLEENKDNIDFAFMNRPHITEKYIDFFKEKMNTKLAYFGHDLHFLRAMREYEITGDEEKRLESADWKKKELDIINKVDLVLYPSTVETNMIKEINSDLNAKTLILYIYDEFLNYDRKSKNNKGIMFVGGFSHTPNVDAVKWFVEEVYSKVREKMDIPFYIVGSNPPEEIKALHGNGIDVKGFVSDEELNQLYRNCKLVVVPLRYGAGVKGKVVEAIYNGAPTLTTSIGAEGIPDIEDVLVVKDEAEEFADSIIKLYNDDAELDRLSKNMQKYIKEYNSLDAAWEVIGEDFE
ncbi:MAG: glycosyltransferase [Lachnospiraceae bacterium]|nr:glycosyltransferase [Lachnospiraceae bacterium]